MADEILGQNEIRRDYRTGDYAIIAPDRGKRPEDFHNPKVPEHSTPENCPFERGKENTNTEIMRVGDPWQIRAVENKFPELYGNIPVYQRDGVFAMISGYGYNEVVIDTPSHNEPFESMDNDRLLLWLNMIIEREDALYLKKYIKHVHMFKNSGRDAGESLDHAHTQIMAWPELIGRVRTEYDAASKYTQKNGSCLYEKILDVERYRLLIETNNFVCIAPFASRMAGESMILPKRHLAYLGDLTDKEREDLVQVLKQTLLVNRSIFGNLSYNFVSHEIKAMEDFHMHIEIYPRLAKFAGVELGEGVFVNQLPPEIYSESFRKLLK